jgi:hypothetical protein
MNLLNAGIPFILIEYPLMIMGLLAVVLVEYYLLRRWGWNLSPVLWSNVASTLVGIPLSTLCRALAGGMLPGYRNTNPFLGSIIVGGELNYEGGIWLVYLIILVFDYIFSALIEYFIYRLTYKQMAPSLLLKRTALANLVSYLVLVLLTPVFFYALNVVRF